MSERSEIRKEEQVSKSIRSMPFDVDKKKMEEDQEIRRATTEGVEVQNQQNDYEYVLVYRGVSGLLISRYQAKGWEFVKGDMIEHLKSDKWAREKTADGTRILGDCVLMRRTKDLCEAERGREKAIFMKQLGIKSWEDSIQDINRSLVLKKGRGITVTSVIPDVLRNAMDAQAARQAAFQRLDTDLRNGTI